MVIGRVGRPSYPMQLLRLRRRWARQDRRVKKCEEVIEEETAEDIRSLRTWRLVPAPAEVVFEDALAGREVRVAAIARGKNPAVLDVLEMELAEKVMDRCEISGWSKWKRNPATFILGRVPADFKARIQHTRSVLASSPGRLIAREGREVD